MAKKPELRRSQIVFTYGPGSVVDLRTPKGSSVSGIMRSSDDWNQSAPGAYSGQKGQEILLERLRNIINERYDLDINNFRWPPVEFLTNREDLKNPTLDSIRFPSWLTCPQCFELKQSKNWVTGISIDKNCSNCSKPPVPTRFILICDDGHIDDFPYEYWLKAMGKGGDKEGCIETRQLGNTIKKSHLKLKLLQGDSLSLASMYIKCDRCKRSASMRGIFDNNQSLFKCNGKKEWATDKHEDCNKDATVQQRSSRAIWLPIHESAIDIPPYNDLPELLGSYWEGIQNVVKATNFEESVDDLKNHIKYQLETINSSLADLEYTEESLFDAVKDHNNNENKADENPRVDEFKRLNDEIYHDDDSSPDILLKFEKVPDSLKNSIDKLVRVVRMREIRALVGFTRKSANNKMNHLSEKNQKWLPAIETNGEGIFFSFHNQYIENLETELELEKHKLSIKILENWKKKLDEDTGFFTKGPTRDTEINIKFIFLHTLAHMMIRQLSLDSGYNSASLHERIYCGKNMSGILIYTASVDSEGTLGGLSRIGKSLKFEDLLNNTMEESKFCSSDPLCSYGDMTISEPLNGSACYCCNILPETCCDHFNLFLDRNLLEMFKI